MREREIGVSDLVTWELRVPGSDYLVEIAEYGTVRVTPGGPDAERVVDALELLLGMHEYERFKRKVDAPDDVCWRWASGPDRLSRIAWETLVEERLTLVGELTRVRV